MVFSEKNETPQWVIDFNKALQDLIDLIETQVSTKEEE